MASLVANENIAPYQEDPLQLMSISPRAEDACQHLPDNTAASHGKEALQEELQWREGRHDTFCRGSAADLDTAPPHVIKPHRQLL